MTVRIGTRASNLAMWQAKTVSAALEASGVATELVPLTSTGDRSLGGQLSSSVGQFIHSIDNRLLSGEIDIAVHSSKDVPVEVDDRITNLAYLERGRTTDLVLMRKTPEVPVLEEVLATETSTPLATYVFTHIYFSGRIPLASTPLESLPEVGHDAKAALLDLAPEGLASLTYVGRELAEGV